MLVQIRTSHHENRQRNSQRNLEFVDMDGKAQCFGGGMSALLALQKSSHAALGRSLHQMPPLSTSCL
ncbi:hypothetical protein DV515_00012295 [Chloebia gouldiae]|uniref:Uncharacterized protein n=1 Tax=Chloebia gouldiae TaxID=44316 RepID=A0A3L8S408_CHLGU|nr:hypothetical protein DV515_00012295 [Chloebia gouldiae]